MRKFVVIALMLTAAVVPAVNLGAPVVSAATVPSGFTDSPVATMGGSTGLVGLPDGTVLVLEQSGTVRLIRNDVLLSAPALTMSLSPCNGGERGLLGVALDPDFEANGQLYLYFTRPEPSAPGGCVNRVSRFTMSGAAIDPNSEVVLVDNISSVAGNHNGGDVEVGGDGYLYISVGDAGSDPRGGSSPNDAAQDLSLLNGKILRVTTSTGDPAPGNPLSGAGTASCRVRGNTPATPTTNCQEIFAWGLRNPYRFAFDPNTGVDRFFINDVGQTTREEVDLGAAGANYGWPMREGQCPIGLDPPCAGPAAGLTDPITDYGRTDGHVITAGAFIPNGHWPSAYDGGYLFADAFSGSVWLRTAAGSVDYGIPFATTIGSIADMAFVSTTEGIALYYTLTGGAVRKITGPTVAPIDPGPLAFRSIPAGTRALDTRLASAGAKPIRAGHSRYISMGVNPAVTKAVLVNFGYILPSTPGFLSSRAGRTQGPLVSNVNAFPNEVVANAAIVPVDANGGILIYSRATAHVIVDVLGYFDAAPTAVAAGRFTALPPQRIVDTRNAPGAGNEYTVGSGPTLPKVNVPVSGRGGMPTAANIGAAVLVVTVVTNAGDPGGFVTATAGGSSPGSSSNINTMGNGDVRPNLVVVPVAADGSIDLHLLNIPHVIVDVAGYFTSGSAAAATAGRFRSIAPHREVDTRFNLGFGRLPGGTSGVLDPTTAPPTAAALAHNIAIVDNAEPGFVTPFPGGAVPLVSAGNTVTSGQARAVLSFTRLSAAPASMSYFTPMATDLVVDTPGYFEGG